MFRMNKVIFMIIILCFVSIRIYAGSISGKEICDAAENYDTFDHLKSIYKKYNIDTDTTNAALWTAISYDNRFEVAKFLIKNGANVDNKKFNPLELAVELGNVRYAEFLINHGAKIYEVDDIGSTLLHIAVGEETTVEMLELLLDKGLKNKINTQDDQGETPLHLIWFIEYNANLTKCLLEYGADPNIENNDGETLLDNALFEREYEIVPLLKEYGAIQKSER